MRFVETTAENRENGYSSTVYYIDPFSTNLRDERRGPRLITEITGERRALVADYVKIASLFNKNALQRSALRHDAGVFALACSLGYTFDDQLFNEPGGLIVKSLVEFEPDDDIEPIEASRFSRLGISQFDLTMGRALPTHVMVRADLDMEDPLYLSKLGRLGPVVLSTSSSMRTYYQTDMSGEVTNLAAEAYE